MMNIYFTTNQSPESQSVRSHEPQVRHTYAVVVEKKLVGASGLRCRRIITAQNDNVGASNNILRH